MVSKECTTTLVLFTHYLLKWTDRIYTHIFLNGRYATCFRNKDGGRQYTNQSREPIDQENHVVSAKNYVRNFNFIPRFWSLLNDKNSLYIRSSSNTHSLFTFSLTGPTHSFQCDFQRELSQFQLTESTHSSSFYIWLPQPTTMKMYTTRNHSLPCNILSVRLFPASKTEISSNQTNSRNT